VNNIKTVAEFKQTFTSEAKNLKLRARVFTAPDKLVVRLVNPDLNYSRKSLNLTYFKSDITAGRYDTGDIVGIIAHSYTSLA